MFAATSAAELAHSVLACRSCAVAGDPLDLPIFAHRGVCSHDDGRAFWAPVGCVDYPGQLNMGGRLFSL